MQCLPHPLQTRLLAMCPQLPSLGFAPVFHQQPLICLRQLATRPLDAQQLCWRQPRSLTTRSGTQSIQDHYLDAAVAPNDLDSCRDTIVALSSGPGRSGVAVIRMSGPTAGVWDVPLPYTLSFAATWA
jgi:hypothetical protein